MMDILVSVIVPVYKVEPFLQKCVDSIIGQTYTNIEIILIDDGSPDRCGQMCDEYASQDDRIQVIHQENKGLSGARNAGLDVCKGEFIAFADSDDWLEADTIEGSLRAIMEYEAQVCCFGSYSEYQGYHVQSAGRPLQCFEGEQILLELMRGSLSEVAWNKVWKADLFKDIWFPQGVNHEDIGTIWKLLDKCDRIVQVPEAYYHYLQRADGICRVRTAKTLCDHWSMTKGRYDALSERSDEMKLLGIKTCFFSAARIWSWTYVAEGKDSVQYQQLLKEVNAFVRKHYGCIKKLKLPMSLRVGVFFARYNNKLSFFCSYLVNRAYRKIRGAERLVEG